MSLRCFISLSLVHKLSGETGVCHTLSHTHAQKGTEYLQWPFITPAVNLSENILPLYFQKALYITVHTLKSTEIFFLINLHLSIGEVKQTIRKVEC